MTGSGKPRILVIEDSAMTAMLMEEMLEELGFEVVGPVTDHASACQMVQESDIAAAVLDVNLYGVMSWDVAMLLKEAHVPFAFSTGYGSAAMLPPALADVPVLAKPFDSKCLEQQLYSLLASGSARRSAHPQR